MVSPFLAFNKFQGILELPADGLLNIIFYNRSLIGQWFGSTEVKRFEWYYYYKSLSILIIYNTLYLICIKIKNRNRMDADSCPHLAKFNINIKIHELIENNI